MSGEIYMAAGGALAYEKRLQIIANNLANSNTVGYKQDQGQFKIYNLTDIADEPIQNGVGFDTSQANLFWNRFNVYTDHSPGSLKNTGNDLDLALVGKGFFCVQTPDGIHYTRKGDFTLNADGVLSTRNGWPVMGESGEISVKDQENPQRHKKFSVDEEGNISVDGNQIDRLQLVDFQPPYNLSKVGEALFKPTGSQPAEIQTGDVRVSQGFLELSNVDAVKMMTEMIEVLRGYESYQKIIRSVDEVNSRAINEIGKMT
ncbi:MAG: flagellar basal-body rod protein FlgF [Desulfobacterales bacterium]|jgi:flagellar basal-body rod protein FlgG